MYLYADNISKSYDGENIIENISMGVEKGELVSLIGLSGIGKTTLFNILSGLESPDTGRVMLDNVDITGVAGKVGYMQQNDLLMPFKTVLDNVCVPLRLKGIKKKEAQKSALAYFEEFGLTGSEKKYPAQLSGGMRQRAALLRSHLMCSDIMLLDEPFSALDAFTKNNLHIWFRNIIKNNNDSGIFITHDIDEAINLSDKIYVMTGRPGTITGAFNGCTGERNKNFNFTDEFIELKHKILNSIS